MSLSMSFICSSKSLCFLLKEFAQRQKQIGHIEQNPDGRLKLVSSDASFSRTLHVEFKLRDYNFIDVQHRRFDWMITILADHDTPILVQVDEKAINVTFTF